MTDREERWEETELVELRKVFFAQAYEIVDEMQDALLKLEEDPGDESLLKAAKRHIHTLKGDSNSIGLTAVGKLCHRMEDVLAPVMAGSDQTGHEAIEVLIASADALHQMLAAAERGEDAGESSDALSRIDGHLHRQSAEREPLRLTEYEELQVREARTQGRALYDIDVSFHPECGEKGVAAMMTADRFGAVGQILRTMPPLDSPDIDRADRFRLLFATEKTPEAVRETGLVTGITTDVRIEAYGAAGAVEDTKRHAGTGNGAPSVMSDTLRIEASKVDRIMDLIGELIIGRSMVDQISREVEGGASAEEVSGRLFAVNSYLDRTVSDLQKGAMKMRMVPVQQVFRKFPRMVRDLAAATGKQVRLELDGKETELDKSIVDALGEPLAHLIRNAVDHGIETAEERRAANKPEEGRIVLRAYHESSLIVIEITDDGKGIDPERLRRQAVDGGFLTPEQAGQLTNDEARELLFLSGLSTAGTVTETSGRGVGMDAVKTAVEGLKGVVEIASVPGKGTTFRMRLPLTLAVIKALLFEVGTHLFAVPVASIAEVAKVMTDDIMTVDGRKTFVLRDQTISVIALDALFRVEGSRAAKKFLLVLAASGRKVGLLIDRLMWQQELVIKAVDEEHARSDVLAGASILGNGSVVLIIDALAVWKKAVEEERRKLVTT